MNKEEKEQWLYDAYQYTSNFNFNRLDKYEEANDDICIDDLILDYTMLYEFHKEEIERLNSIINKGKIYCEDVIQEHENGEYNVSTTQLAIEEHKKNIMSLLNILNGDLENYWRSDKE